MQDHRLDPNGATAQAPIEHLDLVTAELRRRIAGIGLAIAELREETGRLRATADERYHAVAVLDRSPGIGTPDPAPMAPLSQGTMLTDRPDVVTEAPPAAPMMQVPTVAVQPPSPWCDAPPEIALGAPGAVAEPLTWVPPSAPVETPVPATAEGAVVTEATPADEQPPSLWADGDGDDAAFEAFFSTEIEPEPSQRWLLSD